MSDISRKAVLDQLLGGMSPMPSHVTGGVVTPGTVDLYAQPEVPNPDGTKSTVDSIGVNIDGKEYLLPTVTPDGRHFTGPNAAEQAVQEFYKTGRHLGVYDSPLSSDLAADTIHQDYAKGKYRVRPAVSHK